jgi:plasmid stability protein
MATITIRNLDSQLKTKLRIRAAQHDRSMEEEVRTILKTVLASDSPSDSNLATSIHNRFRVLGGVELVNVVREPIRDPEGFSE